jgi:hypothetical protein
MYRTNSRKQQEFPDFYLPFSGHLDPDNRWIALARLVPWELVDEIYAEALRNDRGAPALPSRLAFGAILIKERLGLTDRETVEAIRENPYLQFFIGNEEFIQSLPFDASLMVGFRKRFGEQGLTQISEAIALASIEQARQHEAANDTNDQEDDSPPSEADTTANDANDTRSTSVFASSESCTKQTRVGSTTGS